MRRYDKEIKNPLQLEKILERAKICRIALIDEGWPYIVPMNYGYNNRCIYLHSASHGRKIEILKKNNHVCFEMECQTEIQEAENPCQYGMKYYSLIGWGRAYLVSNYQEKVQSLNFIMQKYSTEKIFTFDDEQVNLLTIIQIKIDELTGKISGY